jgi:hypothetical protein
VDAAAVSNALQKYYDVGVQAVQEEAQVNRGGQASTAKAAARVTTELGVV